MKAPTVLDGPRAPNLDLLKRDPNLVGNKPGIPGQATVPVGVVDEIEKANTKVKDRTKFRFRSPNSARVVLLYAEPDALLPGGRIVRGKIYQAKFKDGFWETRDGWMTSDGKIITHEQQAKWLMNSQYYSSVPNEGEMWDADLEEQTAALAMYRGFVAAVQSDPKLLSMLKKDLAATDFDMISALAQARKPIDPAPAAEPVQDSASVPSILS
jgi:hypothetical protein